jgi:AcrR family transcriptional regulator
VAEGWGNITMRKIADRIEFSAAALYEYFPNKRDLLADLARQGFIQLNSALKTSRHDIPEKHLFDLVARLSSDSSRQVHPSTTQTRMDTLTSLPSGINTKRIEALGDGIFAIAKPDAKQQFCPFSCRP